MNKYYNKTNFKINDELTATCQTQDTRYGFRHLASLYNNEYRTLATAKACYYNRTWECFNYESILQNLLSKTELLTEQEKKDFLANAQNNNNKELDAQFGTIAKIAKLGEIFGQTKKEKNDWKSRMIKAGLENKGLIMPDDWETLTEDDKEARLNGVIGQLAGNA